MKKQNKNLLLKTLAVSCIVAGLGISGANLYQKRIREKAEQKQRAEQADKLAAQNMLLNMEIQEYKDSLAVRKQELAQHTKNNPNYDDIESLYDMAIKMDSVMWPKYDGLENNFIKKCQVLAKPFANRRGEYPGEFPGDCICPNSIEDWMTVVLINCDNVPTSLEQEYNDLIELRSLIWDYEYFLAGDMDTYLYENTDDRKAVLKDRKVLETEESRIDVGDGYVLEGTLYKYVDDKISRYNDMDNVEQDRLVKSLFMSYFAKFREFANKGMNVIDAGLYKKITEAGNIIMTNNNLESNVISYEQALIMAQRSRANNEREINNLLGKVR